MKLRAIGVLILWICLSLPTFSQNSGVQYQAVIRDTNGAILSDDTVSIAFLIHEDSLTGQLQYREEHLNVVTNEFGLVNLVIGNGNPVQGSFSGIPWQNKNQFIEVQIDVLGGTNFSTLGGFSFQTVPYAYHAITADSIDDADADPTNELQSISILNDTITLSGGGGSLNLSGYDQSSEVAFLASKLSSDSLFLQQQINSLAASDSTYSNRLDSLNGKIDSSTLALTLKIQADSLHQATRLDTINSDNQTLSLKNDSLFIEGANAVSLSPYRDSAAIQQLANKQRQDSSLFTFSIAQLDSLSANRYDVLDTRILRDSINLFDSLAVIKNRLDSFPSDEQNLSLNGDTLFITNGDSVNLNQFRDTAAINILSQALIDSTSATRSQQLAADSQLQSNLTDSTAQIRSDLADSLSTLDFQLSSNLADTASTLRGLISGANTDNQNLDLNGDTLFITNGDSVNLNTFRDTAAINSLAQALVDSTSATRSQLQSNLTDSTAQIRSDLADSLSTLDFQLSSNLADTASTLRGLISGTNTDDQNLSLNGDTLFISNGDSVNLNQFRDTAAINNLSQAIIDSTANTRSQQLAANSQLQSNLTDSTAQIRSDLADSLSTLDFQLSSNLADTASTLRGLISGANTDNQNLSLNGDTLFITNGDSVNLNQFRDTAAINILSQALTDSTAATRSQQLAADSQLQSNLTDSTAQIRSDLADSLSTLDFQLSSNLADTASTLRGLISGANTDNQNLDLNGDTLFITNGDSVNLNTFRDTAAINSLAQALVDSTSATRSQLQAANSQLQSNLTDSTAQIRSDLTDSLSTLNFQLSSNLADTASQLRSEQQTANSQQLTALQDSTTNTRAQLADTASTLRSLISSSGSDNQNLTLSGDSLFIDNGTAVDLSSLSDSAIQANIDSSAALRNALLTAKSQQLSALQDSSTNIKALLADSTAQLRSDQLAANSQQQAALSDTASAIRADLADSLSTLDFQLSSNLADTAAQLRSEQQAASSQQLTALQDSTTNTRAQLTDTASTLRGLITGANTDDQNLTLSGDSLFIDNGTAVDLSSLSDSAIQANIDSSAALRNALLTAKSQQLSALQDSSTNIKTLLADSTSQLRTEQLTANSQQLAALSDTASALRASIPSSYQTKGIDSVLAQGKNANGDSLYNLGYLGLGTNAPNATIDIQKTTDNFSISIANAASSSADKKGVFADVTGLGSGDNFGLYGGASGGTGDKYGVYGEASGTSGSKYGLYGTATGTNAFAGYFDQGMVYIDNQLGVGLASPSRKVEIAGDLQSDSAFFNDLTIIGGYSFPTFDGDTGEVLTTDGNGNLSFQTVLGDHLGNHTLDSNLRTNSFYISNDGDDEGLFIDSDGHVAIDTTDEVTDEVFTVKSNLNSWGLINTAGDVSLGTWLYGNAGQLGTFSNHRLEFITNNSAARMVIDTNGNVAIGANPLDNKFRVFDNFQQTSGGYEASEIYSSGTASSGAFQRALAVYIEGSDGENAAIGAFSLGASAGTNRGVFARADSGTSNIGVRGVATTTPAGANFAMGLQGQATSVSDGINYGTYGEAANSTFINRGVVGVLSGSTSLSDAAVYGIANGSGQNVSLYGRANNTNSGGVNYGLYSTATGADTNYAAYFAQGDVFVGENLIIPTGASSGSVLTSDGSGYASWQTPVSSPWSNTNNYTYTLSDSIGIGTSTPEYNLDINVIVRSWNMRVRGTGNTWSGYTVEDTTSTNAARVNFMMSGTTFFNNALSLGTYKNGQWTNPLVIQRGAPTITLLIDSTGNVSVGTDTTVQLFDVNGRANMDTLTINNSFTLPNDDGTNGQVLQTNGGGVVSWEDAAVDTDDQVLTYDILNKRLSITDGNSVVLNTLTDTAIAALNDSAAALRTAIGSAGDDLGNHNATTNLQLNGNFLSNDGDNEGIGVSNTGTVSATPATTGAGNQAFRSSGDIWTIGQGTGLYFTNTNIGITGNNGNSGDILFKTGGTNHIRITSGGLVGIGETSPSYKLDVGGTFSANSININDAFTLPTSDGTNGQVLQTDGSGNATWDSIPGDNLGNHTATTNLDLGTNTLVGDGGSQGIRINSSGKVGVGGAAQTNRRLYVVSSIDQYTAQFNNTVSGATNTSFGVEGRSTGSNPSGSNIGVKGEASGGGTNVAVQGIGAGSGSYSGFFMSGKFFIADSLGVGTGNPTARVDVLGTATMDTLNINNQFTLPSTDGTNGQVLQTDGSGNVTWDSIPSDNLGNHTATENIQLNGNFLSNDGDNEGIIIQNDGDVGIGTPNPSANLHVTEDIKLTQLAGNGITFTSETAIGNGFGQFTYDADVVGTGEPSMEINFFPRNNANTGTTPMGNITMKKYLNKSRSFMVFKTKYLGAAAEVMRLDSIGRLGLGTSTPAYKLDVSGSAQVDSLIVNGNYGLPASDGTNGQVLQTDGSGNVTWGSAGTWSQNTDTTYTLDHVGIGTSDPGAKLSVYSDDNTFAGEFFVQQTTSSFMIGLYGGAQGNGSGAKYGAYFEGRGTGGAINLGAYGTARGSSSLNIGLWGSADSASANNRAVYAKAEGGTLNEAVYAQADSATTGSNYAVFANAANGAQNYALYAQSGDVVINDSLRIQTNLVGGDAVLKSSVTGAAYWEVDTLTCPAGFTKVNEAFCIETNERPASNWFVADSTCAVNGYELPQFSDWYSATAIKPLSGEVNNWEWVSNISQNNMMVVGNGTRRSRSFLDPESNSQPYRCVYRK